MRLYKVSCESYFLSCEKGLYKVSLISLSELLVLIKLLLKLFRIFWFRLWVAIRSQYVILSIVSIQILSKCAILLLLLIFNFSRIPSEITGHKMAPENELTLEKCLVSHKEGAPIRVIFIVCFSEDS